MKRSHGAVPTVPLDAVPENRQRRSFSNLQPGTPRARKPFEIRNAAEDEGDSDHAEVFIYAEIGESWWGDGVSAQMVVDALAQLDVSQIDLHINSPGGDIFDGVAIYNAFLRHKAKITVYVDALAASAASFIAQAGDEIIMTRASTMMIHDGWGFAMGNAADMRDMADVLDKLSNNIASIYQARAGGTVEDWRAVMVGEAWYTADEAVEAGLADSVQGAGEAAENRWDLSVFNHAGRSAAPSPELIRQSVLLNRTTKESLMPPIRNAEGTESTETTETVEVTEEATVDPAPAEQTVEGTEQAGDAEQVPPVEPAEEELSPERTSTAAPQARAAAPTSVLINGVPTSDPSAIQAHINTLEGFASESKAAARNAFIDELVSDGRIGAPQADSMKALVADMSDAQYNTYKAAYENAPRMPLLARHGVQASGTPSADKARADRIEVLQGIVNHHKAGGMKDEALKETPSYKELQTLLEMSSGQDS